MSESQSAGRSMPAPMPAGPASTLLLGATDIRRLVTMKEVIHVVGQAARERAAGDLIAAPRVALPGGTLLMAAESAERGGVAAKVVSIATGNRQAGLTTIQGLASWLDYTTRRPLLVADTPAVTALRTGALAGFATQELAPPDASVLAMIGTGGQALTLVEACAAVRPVARVQLASSHRESAEELRRRLRSARPDLEVRICDSVRRAVQDAALVCLATTSVSTLVEAGDVRPDVHINAVGAYRPDMRELGASVLGAAELVCSDDPAGALREAGDLMEAVACGALRAESIIDLGELDARFDRAQRRGITIFKSVGTASADLALLDLLWQRAEADGSIPRFEFSA
jgi:ornithine cyclodeaminase/alanine dehydrogenase-like protein (mu-crystallin family)